MVTFVRSTGTEGGLFVFAIWNIADIYDFKQYYL